VPATLPPLPPPHFLPLVPLPSVPLPLPLSSLHRLHPPPLRLIHRSSSCSTRRCLPLAMLDHNSLLFSPTRDGVPSSDDNFYASDLIAAQDALEDEAREAIPFASTECTYDMGYVKQPLFACLTCLHNRAVCAGCSVSCHGCALLPIVSQGTPTRRALQPPPLPLRLRYRGDGRWLLLPDHWTTRRSRQRR
jgi:hypothetical protein